MSFVLSIENTPWFSDIWWAQYSDGWVYSGWLDIDEPWNCPYGAYGATDLKIYVYDSDYNLKHESPYLGPIYDDKEYVYDCSTGILSEITPESQFRNLVATSVYPSTAMVGDSVNVNFELEHIGESERVTLYAAIGNQGYWFDEILHTQFQYTFPQHSVWTKQYMFASIEITSAISPGVYDAYVKIVEKNLISPTLYDCLTILESQPEFYNFRITSYQKV